MKGVTKLQASVIAIIIIVAAAAGAYYYTSYQPTTGVFKIGAFFPFTGPYGTQAIEQKNALLLAIEDINKEGGILGRRVEAIIYDDQLKVDQAILMVD
ncbi:ABC transporter substrate-binding protein, partial [Candidatus Bathyarchaeota archaeon]|nr:ABC transporter substrate-binding protein [Candidatus Bathyarchaeota archaeon]